MKNSTLFSATLLAALTLGVPGFVQAAAAPAAAAAPDADKAAAARAKSDADAEKKAAEWAASLKLDDQAKQTRVAAVIATHIKSVRDWHNEHPPTTVPEGINPTTGKKLSNLERMVIADTAMPKTVHQALMEGLHKDLSEEQVEAVLDKFTVGKVEFTMNGYRSIVPNLTKEEETTIYGFLKQAREQAVDLKDVKNEMSAIFEIYKTKSEQYLNSKGRDWHQMYKAYTDKIKAQKAAAAATRPAGR
jgi:hypothetical protein